ncbi:MAG: hypothetical protein M3O30_17340 [Planctomycetota bacterium]|nr:hypothetical protein [Planctomycetota bacterium]
MGIATERFSDRRLRQSIEGNWTAQRGWDVIAYTSALDAVSSTGVALGDSHPLADSLSCVSIEPEDDKLTKCIVRAQYAITSLNANPVDPTARAPFIGWKRSKISQPTDTDINGNPILNSAKDAFRTNGTRTFSVKFLRFTRWEPFFDSSVSDMYTDTVNNAAVVFEGISYDAGQVYLHAYLPVEDYQSGCNFVKNYYEFEIRTPKTSGLTVKQKRHPFQRRQLDQGLRAQYSSSGTNTFGNLWLGGPSPAQATRDVLLNGKGQPIDSTIMVTQSLIAPVAQTPPSTVLTDTTSAGVTWLIFMDYAETDFSTLGILP